MMQIDRTDRDQAVQRSHSTKVGFFLLAILGFSFWFFLAVPFASHRETYSWLADVGRAPLSKAVSFISVTYRPLAQFTTWMGFEILNPGQFPTSVWRQALVQGIVYGTFLLGWWYIVSAAAEIRLFSLVAFVAGGVYFPGYVHLFHVYGLFYAPVLAMLGAVFCLDRGTIATKGETWLAVVAPFLVLWHPFATALFLGFYFGRFLETFKQRTRSQLQFALGAMGACSLAIVMAVVVFPRADVSVPLHTKLIGWLVAYRTNEVNEVALVVSLVLTAVTIYSMNLRGRAAWAYAIATSLLAACFLAGGLPCILLWLCAVAIKFARRRKWGLFFLQLAAIALPFGAVIGSPVFGLFAIIVAAYGTAYGWEDAERRIEFLKWKHVGALVAVAIGLILLMRAGIEVPILTKAASPLLAERERTYQLEAALAWLHQSSDCRDEVGFAEQSGSPIDSLADVLSRKNRPPAGIEDVRYFWDRRLRCARQAAEKTDSDTAIITFGGERLAGLAPIYSISGKYAGDATIWVPDAAPAAVSPGEDRSK